MGTARNGRPRPRMQGFVFTWKGHAERAARLERLVGSVMPVTVINSEPEVAAAHPHWVTLDDSAYFAAQWNEAMARFDADILFHIQADAYSDQLPDIVRRAAELFDTYPIGVYEPNVDYTDHVFQRDKLRAVTPEVLEVPYTDTTCWLLAREVVARLPPFDLARNKLGWGVSRVAAALCQCMQRLCVRDYAVLVQHPKGRGYDSQRAWQEMVAYLGTVRPEVVRECQRLHQLSLTQRQADEPPV